VITLLCYIYVTLLICIFWITTDFWNNLHQGFLYIGKPNNLMRI